MKKKIVLVGIIIAFCSIMGRALLFPSTDYMKMTFSEKIQAGYSAHILVNGDSIGGSVADGEWCTRLVETIEEDLNANVELNNISKPGNSSIAGIVSWEMMDKTEQSLTDLVILCYGQNDQDDSSFEVNYEALIRNTIRKNPNAEVIAILESSQKEYTNKIKTIMKLCDYYDIPYVDMINVFENSGYTYEELSDDGIHPNTIGKKIYANAIYNVIKTKLLKKQHFFDFKGERPQNRSPLNSASNIYMNFQYISLENMDIQNNIVHVEIPEDSILGLDLNFIKGNHGITMTLSDGGEKKYVGYSWEYDAQQRHIYQILSGKHKETKVQLTFSLMGDIENLHGIFYFY